MGKTVGRIIRKGDVKVEGVFQLGTTRSATSNSNARVTHSVKPSASVIETNPEFAIIEITCSCGTKTSVKCEYPNQTAG